MNQEENQSVAEPVPPQPAKRWVLLLDADGIYQGARETTEDQLRDGDIALDHQPDNPPGKYQWQDGMFVPIPPKKGGVDTPLEITATRVLAALIADLRNSGVPLSPGVSAWQQMYLNSVDATGLAAEMKGPEK